MLCSAHTDDLDGYSVKNFLASIFYKTVNVSFKMITELFLCDEYYLKYFENVWQRRKKSKGDSKKINLTF